MFIRKRPSRFGHTPGYQLCEHTRDSSGREVFNVVALGPTPDVEPVLKRLRMRLHDHERWLAEGDLDDAKAREIPALARRVDLLERAAAANLPLTPEPATS